MEWGIIASLIGLIGWVLAIRLSLRQRAIVLKLARLVEAPQSSWRPVPQHALNEMLACAELLATHSYEGESVNNLLRLCHSHLGARAIELQTSSTSASAEIGVMNSAASVRLTSGRPVSSSAHCHPLKLGSIVIGHLRFDAPALNAVQQRLLQRIAQALTLQLVADRTGRELRHLVGVDAGAERARTGFMASLSHELRGPLGMVLNAVELVRDELCGPINADQRETLGLVHGNVRHLLSLVNDVLDFAKTESGAAAPKRESLALRPILEELVGSARGQADAKQQRLSLSIADASAQLKVLFDERHLRQILLNLMTNAIKYTPPAGDISVTVNAAEAAISIAVRDSGVGIPENERHKVFSPFERVSTGLNQQGTGLGMPLSQALANANEGTLTFSSSTPGGSTFVLTLPVASVALPGAGLSDREHSGSAQLSSTQAQGLPAKVSLKGQSLLLASRDEAQRVVLVRALVALDAVVSPFEAGAGPAFGFSDTQQPVTAIIIDSTMILCSPDSADSKLSSPSSISSWVSLAQQHRVPLVMLTPRAFEFDTAEYLRSGVDVCVAKPFQTNELALVLQRIGACARESPETTS